MDIGETLNLGGKFSSAAFAGTVLSTYFKAHAWAAPTPQKVHPSSYN